MAEWIKLSKENVKGILSSYSLGRYVSHKHIPCALGNSVYHLNTSKGRFILKLHQEIDLNNFRHILAIEQFARKKGVPVPENIKTKSGKSFILYDKKVTTIQRFVEGKEGKPKSAREIKTLAKTMAMVGRILLRMPLNKKSKDYDIVSIRKVAGFNLVKQDKLLHKNFKDINKAKLRRSIVHGDLGSNYLIKNNKIVAIIDWADAHENYLILEPAVFIASNFISNKIVEKEKIRIFMREYQRYIKLNKEETRALYYLIQARQLGVISYLASQAKQNKNDAEIRKYLNDNIRRYQIFKKISPSEFLSCID